MPKKHPNASRTFFYYIVDRVVYYFSISDNQIKPERVMLSWFIHIAVNTHFWLCKYTLKWLSLSWWGSVWFSQCSQQKVVTCCCPHLKPWVLFHIISAAHKHGCFLSLYAFTNAQQWAADRHGCFLTSQGSSNSPVIQDELSQINIFIMIIVNEYKTDLNLLYHSSQE